MSPAYQAVGFPVGPTNFGATAEASTPWLQLALYQNAASSPDSLVLACGQRFTRLPPQLSSCTHALLWPWDQSAVRAQELPIKVDETFLLYTLNEHLSRTALIVQPLILPEGADIGQLPIASLPLPLDTPGTGKATVVHQSSGASFDIAVGEKVLAATEELGLTHAVGCLHFLQVRKDALIEYEHPLTPRKSFSNVASSQAEMEKSNEENLESAGRWIPLHLQLGLPLEPVNLCQAVCRQAEGVCFLGAEERAKHIKGQLKLQERLSDIISQYSSRNNAEQSTGLETASAIDLPVRNLLTAGGLTEVLDLSFWKQGQQVLL